MAEASSTHKERVRLLLWVLENLGKAPGDEWAAYEREMDEAVLLDGCGYPGFASAHNVASESAVDRAIEQAMSAGEALIKRPQKVFWGSYSGYVKDPDGFPGEAAHNPSGLKTSREKASPMPPRIGWERKHLRVV